MTFTLTRMTDSIPFVTALDDNREISSPASSDDNPTRLEPLLRYELGGSRKQAYLTISIPTDHPVLIQLSILIREGRKSETS